MTRHSAVLLAFAVVLVGSVVQIAVSRRLLADADGAGRPASATVVNVMAPFGVLFVAASVVYVRYGESHGPGSKIVATLIAASLIASAAYSSLVVLVALAIAVVSHGVRRVWSSVWVVTAASLACAAIVPLARP